MSDAATPAVPAETPAVPAATPAPAPAATPAPAAEPVAEVTVTIPKSQLDQLAKDAARASGNQRKADLFDRHFPNGAGARFQPATPAPAPSADEMRSQAEAEDRKAERGLIAIAASPEFREILDADPTLRDLMVKNPLAVLPLLAPDALDADDALSLVKDALNGRKKPEAPATPAAAPAAPTDVPKPGAVTTPTDQTMHEAVEEARKIPNTEGAIAKMIGVKIGLGK
jgi:hypothetical protein